MPGRNHIVVRGILLQHAPHGFHVIAGKSPVALGIEIAEPQLVLLPELDARYAHAYLSRHEFGSTQRRFMVEKDAAGCMQPVAFAVVHRQPVPERLGDAIGTAWMKWRRLVLYRRLHPAKDLARCSLVKADLGIG